MSEGRGRTARIGEFIDAHDRSVALAVFCLLLALYTATFNGPAASVDAEVSFQTTSALARNGTLAIGGTPEAETLIERAKLAPPGAFPVREGEPRSGEARFYGWYGVGQALVALPFYASGRLMARFAPGLEKVHAGTTRYGSARSEYFAHLFVGWRTPVLGAMTAMLVVLAAIRLGLARRTAFLAGVGYGVTTFAWPQAMGDLSDVQATLLLAFACYALLVLRQQASKPAALVLGSCLGLAFLTRAGTAPMVACICVVFIATCVKVRGSRGDETQTTPPVRRGLLLHGLLPQALALGAWLYLNHARFGDALDCGYGDALNGGLFGGSPLRAAAGLLVSPGKGLLWMAPAVVFAYLGARRAKGRGQRGVPSFIAVLCLAAFVPALLTSGWHGAWTYGPRYLLPALPALWTLAAIGFPRSDIDSRPQPLVLACFVAGLMIQLPGVLVDTFTYHELAVAAASEHFEVAGELPAADREAAQFEAMHFDWGFAAPWAHWRILRHRVADQGEEFLVAEVFRCDSELRLVPEQQREQGFGHLAWVDLSERMGGLIWPAVAAIVLLLVTGLVLAGRGLDPA